MTNWTTPDRGPNRAARRALEPARGGTEKRYANV